ncbi:MAG: prepilin-type N-terminal cleavage/methylation domain-containing protein [Candidatus Omnitrophota bacterium]
MKKGFTLLELIIVIIIIGVLATLGFSQYTKMIEKGRAAEARAILGSLRTMQAAYYLENGIYTAVISELGGAEPTSCTNTHYFSYACAATGTCTATRCTASGKTPNFSTAYTKTLTVAGVFGGDAGY